MEGKILTKQEQIDQWSKLYGRQINEEGYRKIRDILYGFFKMLYEWDKGEKLRKLSK